MKTCKYYSNDVVPIFDHRGRLLFDSVDYCCNNKKRDVCSCGGDRTKCDFYLEVREKASKKQKLKFGEWVSVDDMLPENDYEKHWKDRTYYLVRIAPSGLMRVAKYGYRKHNWWIDSHDCVLESRNYNEVTHWMLLPKQPEGE